MDNTLKIAVMIDADNTQLAKLESVLQEINSYGRIVVKKAYGNWKKQNLKNWEDEVKRLAIGTVQQFDYVAGKNATDISLVIDAMDMLHRDRYDCFALVSSDSDFTPLAIRLRESGAFIIGVGETKTPEAFKNSCDEFIHLEYLGKEDFSKNSVVKTSKQKSLKNINEVEDTDDFEYGLDEIHNLLWIAYEKFQDDEGYSNVASAGSYIKRAKPDFNPKLYGFDKLPDLIEAYPDRYEIKRYKNKRTNIVAYRCL
ncbi:MAG: NYN domain-containing protein [Sphaerochaetaceae bacterium]|nr:NYN domain-containing protein [Sphaerochaetaceae bacterium]